ncbi:MAG: hypothetical protein R3240_08465 [Gammaproteobacteria bacterium]|nr:hypothetical protein [Gammaproteobacteria bacterium]
MVESVLRAANILNVDELEVFHLAARYWSRHTDDIKVAFKEYLSNKSVPHWVLHFSRNVLKAYERGNFEPALFGVFPSHESIQFTWALVFKTPLSLPLNTDGNLLIA